MESSPIRRPVKVVSDADRRTSRLWFDSKDSQDTISGEYYLMGGISWPFAVVQGLRMTINGYAVLCGMQVNTGMITVFENTSFRSVDPIIDATGRITENGLTQWLNRNWMLYQARIYWWYEQGTIHERYARALYKSRMVEPKPRMIECRWSDDGSPEHLLWIHAAEGSLRMVSGLDEEIKAGDNDPKQPCPAKHALLCALVGYEQKRWKDPKDRREWE